MCKGPPSLEFPVRKGARNSTKTKTRGVGARGEQQGRQGEVRRGGAVEPGGGEKARGR